jgi:A/G-specific adenine glycosylase
LVAELMLQQTQVSRVVPAWERFLTMMGTPADCAEAAQSEVVRCWEGLGYHRRSVALHRSAVQITEQHAGSVPDELGALLELPGVGPYTARAVLAFAFERDVAVVDTNVARVLSRAIAGRPLAAGASQAVADALVTPGRGWEHNQAMLDLGALHCTARPRCGSCPIQRGCSWHRAGLVEPDPARSTSGASRSQPTFSGSVRQLRGQILAFARDGGAGRDWRTVLDDRFGAERVEQALGALVGDGLILHQRGQVVLA